MLNKVQRRIIASKENKKYSGRNFHDWSPAVDAYLKCNRCGCIINEGNANAECLIKSTDETVR